VNGVEPRVEVRFPPGGLAVVHSRNADVVVGGALTGVLQALQFRGATAPDALACPAQHSAIDAHAMEVAVGWVASGFVLPTDPVIEQSRVTQAMSTLGWMNRQAHVELLVHAAPSSCSCRCASLRRIAFPRHRGSSRRGSRPGASRPCLTSQTPRARDRARLIWRSAENLHPRRNGWGGFPPHPSDDALPAVGGDPTALQRQQSTEGGEDARRVGRNGNAIP